MRLLGLIGFTVITLVLISSGSAVAQEDEPRPISDDEVNAIAKQLYCPVCEDVPLDSCPTLACIQWRELIRDLLAEGWSEAEIKNYLIDEYGDMVVAVPPPRGFNWLFYVIPPVAILTGSLIFIQSLKAWKSTRPLPENDQHPPEPPADEYVARMEEELRKRYSNE